MCVIVTVGQCANMCVSVSVSRCMGEIMSVGECVYMRMWNVYERERVCMNMHERKRVCANVCVCMSVRVDV